MRLPVIGDPTISGDVPPNGGATTGNRVAGTLCCCPELALAGALFAAGLLTGDFDVRYGTPTDAPTRVAMMSGRDAMQQPCSWPLRGRPRADPPVSQTPATVFFDAKSKSAPPPNPNDHL